MGDFFKIFGCAFVGGILGPIGATWWALNFKGLGPPPNLNASDPVWRKRSGYVFAAGFLVGVVGGILTGLQLPKHLSSQDETGFFTFFAACSLPTFLLSFVLGLFIYKATNK